MKRITLTAVIDNYSSYGFHAQAVLSALTNLPDLYVTVRAIQSVEAYGQKIPDWIKQRMVNGPQPEPDEILLAPADRLLPTPGKRTALITMHESTKLSPMAVEFANRASLIIVPCQWNAAVFSACGVKAPIRVVPLGVDTAAFSFAPAEDRTGTVFGAAGRLAHGFQRKGLQRVIDLFLRAFPCVDDVRLRIKCYPDDPPVSAEDPRIEIVRSFFTDRQLAQWYASLTAFVSLSTGAWELMPHQAMATGRPVIAAKFGGTADYFHDRIGYEVPFSLSEAKDAWAGLGHWAYADDDAVIEAMRQVREQPNVARWKGEAASIAVRDLTWEQSNLKLHAALRESGFLPLLQESLPKAITSSVNAPTKADEGLTVCVTNFHRADRLERTLESCAAAGIQNIVVASMEQDAEVRRVMGLFPRAVFTAIDTDLGCNELWLQAAYRSRTRHVLLLHDDDSLQPEFGAVYESVIAPFLRSGGVVTWRGQVSWDGGNVTPSEYWHGDTRVLPPAELEKFLLTKGRLSLSPIVTVFDRDRLIGALKECRQHLTDPACLLRPGMLLGTEIIAHLRNQQPADKWLYVNQVLSNYGAHPGSGTVAAQNSGDLKELTCGYDVARSHFAAWKDKARTPEPRILFVYSDYDPHDEDERRRCAYAKWTWQFHFDQGEMLEFQVWEHDLLRTSAVLGDPRPVPYVRDLIEHGMLHAQPEDIVVFANRDICLTTMAADRLRAGIASGGGIAIATRRDLRNPQPGQRLRSVLNCKPDGGFDLFAFTPQWWLEHSGKIPDLLIGREAWDTVVRFLAEEISGQRVYVDDVAYHENHGSYWIANRTTNQGQNHNRRIAQEFLTAHGRAASPCKHQFLSRTPAA